MARGLWLMGASFVPPALSTSLAPQHLNAASWLAYAVALASALITTCLLSLATMMIYPFEMATIAALGGERMIGIYYGFYNTLSGVGIAAGNLLTGTVLDLTFRGSPYPTTLLSSRTFRFNHTLSTLASIVWILPPSTFSTRPTWSIPSVSFEPDRVGRGVRVLADEVLDSRPVGCPGDEHVAPGGGLELGGRIDVGRVPRAELGVLVVLLPVAEFRSYHVEQIFSDWIHRLAVRPSPRPPTGLADGVGPGAALPRCASRIHPTGTWVPGSRSLRP